MRQISAQPIGYVTQSAYQQKWGTPRQGAISETASAQITLIETAGDGIMRSKRLAIIWYANLNGDNHNPLKARIKPPKMGGESVGVFATRGVHRPSSIGLTFCPLIRVDVNILYVTGADMILGTPILGIFPAELFLGLPRVESLKRPNWIAVKSVGVVWSLGACMQESLTCEIISLVNKTLSQDPRSLHSIRKHGDPVYETSIQLENRSVLWIIYQHRGEEVLILFATMDRRIVPEHKGRTHEWLTRLVEKAPFLTINQN